LQKTDDRKVIYVFNLIIFILLWAALALVDPADISKQRDVIWITSIMTVGLVGFAYITACQRQPSPKRVIYFVTDKRAMILQKG